MDPDQRRETMRIKGPGVDTRDFARVGLVSVLDSWDANSVGVTLGYLGEPISPSVMPQRRG